MNENPFPHLKEAFSKKVKIADAIFTISVFLSLPGQSSVEDQISARFRALW